MILKEFPDLSWLKSQIGKQFSNGAGWGGRLLKQSGWPTVVLNTTAAFAHRDNILGPLSFFSNLSGASHVTVDRQRVKINPGFFFLSNPGQAYTLEINPEQKPTGDQVVARTETLNIHFGEHFGDDVRAALLAHPVQLLDNPFGRTSAGTNFSNRLYPMNETTLLLIRSLRESTDETHEEEQLYQLLAHLTTQTQLLDGAKNRLPVLKASTREEIVRRLFTSTDYIYTFFDKDLSLDELAQVSCLSKFHYLRLFKIAFGETPHQFITRIRIQRAKDLLRAGDDVRAVGLQVGFADSSSFSRLFRNQTGVYPSRYRSSF